MTEELRSDELHPEMADLLSDLDEADVLPSHSLAVSTARQAIIELFGSVESDADLDDVHDFAIAGLGGDLALRRYDPGGGEAAPILVYFHGGGWVRGNLDTHDELCRSLAASAGCLVVSVDYRRSPEHPFPAAVADCYAATEWVHDHATHLGGDPDRIAVAGDSAGGNLAASVSLLARARGGPPLCRQLLLYPVTDYAFDTPSYEENAEGYLLSRQSMRSYWNHYLDSDIEGANPYASPLQARDLSGLPPASVVTCGFDPLRDEGLAYAERLDEAGVDVTVRNYSDSIHAFISFPDLTRAREARRDFVDDLRATFDA